MVGDDSTYYVDSEIAKSFANDNDMLYMETSAMENINITESFSQLVKEVLQT